MTSFARYAVVSCHAERLLDDRVWNAFERLLRRRPGGFVVTPFLRPPAEEEDETVWLERARLAAALAPFGHHTHWGGVTQARPVGDTDAAAVVRAEADWLRNRGLEPRYFCGGGWYTDDAVQRVVRELGLVDCTIRDGLPRAGVLPTTHSLGRLARAVLGPLPAYVHAYFHDFDLLDGRRRRALVTSLSVLGRRRPPGDGLALAR